MAGQPESTERCAVCGEADCAALVACQICGKPNIECRPDDYLEHWRLGFERVSRALAEAEKELAVWRDEDAREAKYEWVSKQASAAEERLAEAEKALALSCRFGRADTVKLVEVEARTRAAEERSAQAEQRAGEADFARNQEWLKSQAAESRAAQAERALRELAPRFGANASDLHRAADAARRRGWDKHADALRSASKSLKEGHRIACAALRDEERIAPLAQVLCWKCSQPWIAAACGPTHAAIWAQIEASPGGAQGEEK